MLYFVHSKSYYAVVEISTISSKYNINISSKIEFILMKRYKV